MNVWLIHPGELLPVDGQVRLNRYGILAEMLAQRGHSVTIWAPTFVHTTKQYRCHEDRSHWVHPNYRIELLHVPGYRRHIGWARYRFHQRLAERFLERAVQQPRPDVIVSGIPAPELGLAATAYGRQHEVPVLIDVRDLWPDAALDHLPRWMHGAARWLLRPLEARNRRLFQEATGVLGVSEGFRDWGLRHAGRPAGPHDGVFHLGYPEKSYAEAELAAARSRWEALGVREDGRFRVFFLAAIGSLYDLETIIAAARVLEARGDRGVQFLLCGDGPKLARLRRLARGVDSVLLPGFARAVDVHVALQLSHAGVIPYRAAMHTALPNKAVACFSAGLPVLSTQGGEFAAILQQQDCGLTYAAEQPADFLRILAEIRHDSGLRERLSRRARHFYDSELNASRVYSRMIAHLENVAGRTIRRAA